jgi:hypothetical protein
MLGISIGAIPDIWRSVVRDTFGTDPFSASEIHYRRLQDLPTLPTNGAIDGGSTSSGDEFVTTEGWLEDVAEVSEADTGSSSLLRLCLLTRVLQRRRSSRLPRSRTRPHTSRHAYPIRPCFVLQPQRPPLLTGLPHRLYPTSQPHYQHHAAARSSHTVPPTGTAQSVPCTSPPPPADAGTARSSFSRARPACATSMSTSAAARRARDTCTRTCTGRTSRVMR